MTEQTHRMYSIKLGASLDSTWQEWFDNLELRNEEDGMTVLTGIIDDQAVLHTILNKIRNLNIDLISVTFETICKGEKP